MAGEPKMPGRVKVGAFRYSLTSDPVQHLQHEDAEKERLDGRSLHSELRITVSPGLVEDQKRSTVIHELTHCILSAAGFRAENEEQFCRALESGLLGVIRENPRLIAWLQSSR